jgi:transposase InsO family protein
MPQHSGVHAVALAITRSIAHHADKIRHSPERRSTRGRLSFRIEWTFRDFGLPLRIRADNGVPFASAPAVYGLSKLAVWWLRLGIQIERITPGHPQENGRHERMHLTLKTEDLLRAYALVVRHRRWNLRSLDVAQETE